MYLQQRQTLKFVHQHRHFRRQRLRQTRSTSSDEVSQRHSLCHRGAQICSVRRQLSRSLHFYACQLRCKSLTKPENNKNTDMWREIITNVKCWKFFMNRWSEEEGDFYATIYCYIPGTHSDGAGKFKEEDNDSMENLLPYLAPSETEGAKRGK